MFWTESGRISISCDSDSSTLISDTSFSSVWGFNFGFDTLDRLNFTVRIVFSSVDFHRFSSLLLSILLGLLTLIDVCWFGFAELLIKWPNCFWCVFRAVPWMNFLLQTPHWYGFSPIEQNLIIIQMFYRCSKEKLFCYLYVVLCVKLNHYFAWNFYRKTDTDRDVYFYEFSRAATTCSIGKTLYRRSHKQTVSRLNNLL